MAATAIDRATGLASSAAIKAPVYVATTENIALSGLLTIDGVALTAGKRVLVKDQSVPAQNGIYIAASSDWQRAPDLSSNDSVREGTRVFVTDGTTNVQTEFTVTSADPISIGTSAIVFAVSSVVQGAGIVAAALPAAIAAASDEAFVDDDHLIARQASSGAIIKRSWANVKSAIGTAFGAIINGLTIKASPADADEIVIADSAADGASKAVTLSDLVAYLVTKVASAANFRANTNGLLGVNNVWLSAAEVSLTDAATISVDMSTFLNATVTLAGNRTLGQPSNVKVGQSGVIRIVQDATGSRTLAYHADWEFSGGTAPVLSTAASAQDLLFYQVLANNRVFVSLIKGVA